jgi:hypothetical protein
MRGSPAKLLAKLNAKPSRFDRAPSGTDGVTHIDVAHVIGVVAKQFELGGGSPIVAPLLRVKWAHDASSINKLIKLTTIMVAERAYAQKWRMRKPDTIGRMAVLALREREIIRPRRHLTIIDSKYECGPEKCRARGCRGSGRRYSRRQGKDIECDVCLGTGLRLWSDAERASLCHIHHSVWSDNWEARYHGIVDALQYMEGCAFSLMRKFMAEADEE